jgi:hypothetical protein
MQVAKIIPFRERMSTQPPPPPQEGPNGFHPPTHGNVAQWVSASVAVVALLGLIINMFLTMHYHNAEGDRETADEHTNTLIDTKLNPALKGISIKLDSIEEKLDGMGARVGTLDAAVRIISSKQSNQTQELIQELLNSATASRDLPIAKKSIEIASQLTESLREKKQPAPPSFFQDAFNSASQSKRPELQKASFNVQRQLAEYRSTLQETPAISRLMAMISAGQGTEPDDDLTKGKGIYGVFSGPVNLQPGVNMVSDGAVLNGTPIGASLFHAPSKSIASNRITVSGFIIFAQSQDLDGVIWKDVTFVNTHILYNGGDVELQNVKFINCTFDAPINEHGERLLQYAAVLEPSLSIGE